MSNIIDDLGGNIRLSNEVGVTPSAVSNWRSRGIPWKMRPFVARLANERGISLPADFWGESGFIAEKTTRGTAL